MKSWHFGLLATGALAFIGGVACYAYNKIKKKQPVDVIKVIQQCIIENMDTYLKTYQLGLQIKNSQEGEKAKLKEDLKKGGRMKI